MKPRVCMFTDSREPSGMGEHMLTLASELLDQYQLSLACVGAPATVPFVKRWEALGLETCAFDCNQAGLWREQLRHRLCAQEIDIFHCHAGIGWEGHEGVYAAREAGVPVIIRTEHLPYLITDYQQRKDHAQLMYSVDRLICVSAGARDTFIQAGIASDKLEVVRNGIVPRPAATDRRVIMEKLGLRPDTCIVLTVGRFTEQKGHCYLIEAIPAVLEHAPNAHFVWVGVGPLEQELRDRARELNLEADLSFLGHRDDVPAIMAASDLFVLPSIFEGLPLVVLEAMAAGVLVIGTRVCGMSEAIDDGVTGRLVEGANPAALAEGILEALRQPDLTARWREAARVRVRDYFTAPRMARETAAIYEEVLAEKRPQAMNDQLVTTDC